MFLHLLPSDLNVEELLHYLPEDSCKLSIEGVHKRSAYNDVIEQEELVDGRMLLHIGRNGLYDMLPEFMFHPVNRFDNIPEREWKERFGEECQKQEQEQKDARRFFEPYDLILLGMRAKVRHRVNSLTADNAVVQDILGDDMAVEQKENRFVKRAMPFLPKCKDIRGDSTLLTLMLRKIFFAEDLVVEKRVYGSRFVDEDPRYDDGEGGKLPDVFVGNEFCENVITYVIRYWPDDDCNEHFLSFVNEVEVFRLFVQDYFISIEESIRFDIECDGPCLRLSDTITYNYLNYNTNL